MSEGERELEKGTAWERELRKRDRERDREIDMAREIYIEREQEREGGGDTSIERDNG